MALSLEQMQFARGALRRDGTRTDVGEAYFKAATNKVGRRFVLSLAKWPVGLLTTAGAILAVTFPYDDALAQEDWTSNVFPVVFIIFAVPAVLVGVSAVRHRQEDLQRLRQFEVELARVAALSKSDFKSEFKRAQRWAFARGAVRFTGELFGVGFDGMQEWDNLQ